MTQLTKNHFIFFCLAGITRKIAILIAQIHQRGQSLNDLLFSSLFHLLNNCPKDGYCTGRYSYPCFMATTAIDDELIKNLELNKKNWYFVTVKAT